MYASTSLLLPWVSVRQFGVVRPRDLCAKTIIFVCVYHGYWTRDISSYGACPVLGGVPWLQPHRRRNHLPPPPPLSCLQDSAGGNFCVARNTACIDAHAQNLRRLGGPGEGRPAGRRCRRLWCGAKGLVVGRCVKDALLTGASPSSESASSIVGGGLLTSLSKQ